MDGNKGEYIEEDRSSEENYQGISKMYVVENILQHKKRRDASIDQMERLCRGNMVTRKINEGKY